MARVRLVGRITAVIAGAAVGVLISAGAALAHISVSVEPAQPGAADALVTFVAKAESTTAGISSVQVQLPTGIAPNDVRWVSGPPDWLLALIENGIRVFGPPLAVREDLQFAVRIRQLPEVPSLTFKTLQNYSDGRIDRWIELPRPSGGELRDPAPIVSLGQAAQGAPPPGDHSQHTAATAPAADGSGGGLPTVAWLGIGAAVVAILVAVALLLRRRRAQIPV